MKKYINKKNKKMYLQTKIKNKLVIITVDLKIHQFTIVILLNLGSKSFSGMIKKILVGHQNVDYDETIFREND